MRSFARNTVLFAALSLALTLIVGRQGHTQVPPEPTPVQLAKPINTIFSARLRVSPFSVTPSRGFVRVLIYDGVRYVPSGPVLPVDNLRLDGVYVPQLPVLIGFINDRWVILSRP